MRQKIRSSFFYFLCCVFGGSYAAIFLSLFYAYRSQTLLKFKSFFILSTLLATVTHLYFYSLVINSLMAPYSLRQVLGHPLGSTVSSFFGLTYGLIFLVLQMKKFNADYREEITEELAPLLLCAGAGGLLNVCLISVLYLVTY